MSRRFLPIVTLGLWSAGTLLVLGIARAEVKLTSATIRELRNQVQFQPRGERWRSASKGTTMQPLDALRTASKSWAELRFNDRSLARIGERSLFQFLPDTRTFDLRNGTVLLLIPPKQGQTRIQTPNAVAGIRGSALFMRYNPDTDTTVIGALTNSDIEVAQNKEGAPAVTLKAGQIALLVGDRIFEVYNFDLKSFYETSEIVRDLDLPRQKPTPSSDEAIAAVQEETAEALQSQPPLPESGVVANPPWVAYSRLDEQPVVSNPALQNGIDRSLSEGFTNLILVGSEGLTRKPTSETLQNSNAAIVQPPEPPRPQGLGRPELPIDTSSPPPAPAIPPSPQPAIPPGPQPSPTPDPVSSVRSEPISTTPIPAPAPTPEPISRPTPSPANPSRPTTPAPITTQPTTPSPVTPTQPAPAPITTQPTTPTPINRPEPLPAPNPTPVVTPPVATPVPSLPPVTTPTPTLAPIVRPDPQPISTINLPQVIRPTPTPATPSTSTVTTPTVTIPATTVPAVTTPVTVPTTPPTVTTPSPTNTTLPAGVGTTPTVTPGTAPVSPVITPQPSAQGAPAPSPSPAAAPTPEPGAQTAPQPTPGGVTTP